MTQRATARYEGTGWDEHVVSATEGDPVKVARADVTNRFAGDIVGDGTCEYVITYRADGTAAFVGAERVVGRVADREGAFVLQHVGEWIDGAAHATSTVVRGSGSGALAGIRGEARFVAGHEPAQFVLEYDFDA